MNNATTATAVPKELADQIGEWKREYGEVAIFTTRYGTLVVRAPDQEVYERFLDRASADGKDKVSKAAALRELAQLSVLYPSLDEVRAIFKKLPALPAQVGNRCVEMAGGQIEGEIQKA